MNDACLGAHARHHVCVRRGVMLVVVLFAALGAAAGCRERRATVGDPERGRSLLAQYQCGGCHRIPGVAAAHGTAAPTLERFADRQYIAGHVPHTRVSLERWIRDPQAVIADTPMPDLGVSPRDARDMAAYLRSRP